MKINIRQEQSHEFYQIEALIIEAFLHEQYSDQQEHFLVSKIRKSKAYIPELSLVALNDEEEVVGHIILSEITIVNGEREVKSLALAPVSVKPLFQSKGIGSQLIRYALKEAKNLGYESVIVLGHPNYYPKFGFQAASTWEIEAPFDVPNEYFMALELKPFALKNVQGVVKYSTAFE